MNETRAAMSEVVIENVEEIAVKKKWKVKILLFPLMFFAIAIFVDGSFEEALVFSFWGFPFYWFWEKAKKSNNESSWKPATEYRSMLHNYDMFEHDRTYDPSYHGLDSRINS